jgi:cellulose synthase/poly-beta-1,6-N-acetylglucosamine synthase-like glycosyltransferase
VLIAIMIASVSWIALVRPGFWAVGVVFVAALCALVGRDVGTRQVLVGALSIASFVAAIDYMSWRTSVVNWSAWWIAVPLLVAEVFGILHALGVLWTVWPRDERPVANTVDATALPIFILIPTVSEGVDVVGPSIVGAKRTRDAFLATHPNASVSIVVCNDGLVGGYANWADIERLANAERVRCVTRTVPGGAKAGNIEHARDLLGMHGDVVIVVFDADQVAEANFLDRMIPQLADPDVAWVQSGQYYSNLENRVARWAEDQAAIFYRVLSPGKSAVNSAFICGTNVAIRGLALDEIGGFPTDSVTDDFTASIRLHARWKSVFIRDVLATGLGPVDMGSYFKQQRRWAIGTLGVARRQLFGILFARNGFTFEQWVQYALACTHYVTGVKDLVFFIAPLVFLVTGFAAVQGATLGAFLAHFVPYFVVSQAAFWVIAGPVTSIRGIVIGFASFPTLIESILTVAIGRRVGFAVTNKSRGAARSWSHLVPFAVCIVISVVGIAVGVHAGRTGAAGVVSVGWTAWSGVMLVASLAVGIADLGGGEGRPFIPSHDALLRVAARGANLFRRSRIRRITIAGGSVGAMAVVGLVVGASVFAPTAVAHADSAFPGKGLQWGVVVPGSQTTDAVADGASPGIVSRDELVSSDFDGAWANRVAADGGTPWVTLLFGTRAASRAAGPLAIRNGVFDDRLRAWATEVRAHRGPVLITVLPDVDRNWAASSAVAAGGVPADAAAAWTHIRQVFTAAGATNAEFVWEPDTAGDDAAYAPPADAVDAVAVVDLRTTEDTVPNVGVSLDLAAAAHPGKPLLVVLGADERLPGKGQWIASALEQAASRSAVRAIVYHEATPTDVGGTAASWSVASDPESLRAFRALLASSTVSGRIRRSRVLTALAAR